MLRLPLRLGYRARISASPCHDRVGDFASLNFQMFGSYKYGPLAYLDRGVPGQSTGRCPIGLRRPSRSARLTLWQLVPRPVPVRNPSQAQFRINIFFFGCHHFYFQTVTISKEGATLISKTGLSFMFEFQIYLKSILCYHSGGSESPS